MWPFKRKIKNGDYDLAVLGDSLGAYVAVLAAIEQGLRVVWLRSNLAKPCAVEPTDFDSLSPEGARCLAHILAPQDVERVQRGRFWGIHRNGIYTPFDKMLGSGFQFSVGELKTLLLELLELLEKAAQRATIINSNDAVVSFDRHCLQLSSSTLSEPILCRWVINAQGAHSPFSQHARTYLSDDLWLERTRSSKNTDHKHAVFFQSNDNGWCWTAYDKEGNGCKTHWAAPIVGASIPHNAVNARWYKRPFCLEPYEALANPVFLIGSTFCRLDPACGLGATLQIKSAIQAVACIARCLSHPAGVSLELAGYEKMMTSTLAEIAEPMADFYSDYGIRAGKYYASIH